MMLLGFNMTLKSKSKSKKAFSLAEIMIALTIAIFILSLVPFTMGLKLNSKAQALGMEIQAYKIDIKSFYDAFNQLPGDFCRSEEIKAGLSNGDCDGTYENLGVSTNEFWLAWNHLSIYKKYSAIYTGLTGGGVGTVRSVIGVNIPKSIIYEDLGYQINTYLTSVVLNLVRCSTTQDANGNCFLSGIENKVLMRYDVKSDDGIPLTGSIRGFNDSSFLCNTSGAITYNLTSNTAFLYKNTNESGCLGAFLFDV